AEALQELGHRPILSSRPPPPPADTRQRLQAGTGRVESAAARRGCSRGRAVPVEEVRMAAGGRGTGERGTGGRETPAHSPAGRGSAAAGMREPVPAAPGRPASLPADGGSVA